MLPSDWDMPAAFSLLDGSVALTMSPLFLPLHSSTLPSIQFIIYSEARTSFQNPNLSLLLRTVAGFSQIRIKSNPLGTPEEASRAPSLSSCPLPAPGHTSALLPTPDMLHSWPHPSSVRLCLCLDTLPVPHLLGQRYSFHPVSTSTPSPPFFQSMPVTPLSIAPTVLGLWVWGQGDS